MKTLKASQKTARQRGASLIETLIVAGAISSLIALAYVIFSSVMPNSQESKLERQIASLNAAASMYRVSGGYVDPTLSSTQVFAKLKMASNQADADRTVGLSGSMVDPYLKAIALDEEHIDDTSIPRVVWHPGAHRFMLSYEPVAGIKAFELQTKDAHEMTVAKESRNRGGAVNYASVDDWVWDYDEILITYTGPGHIGHVGDGYGGPGAPPVRDGGQLYPPLISVPDGTYPITDFNIQVTLANPNPADSSDIYYSVDRGPVKRYDNEVLSLGPEQFVAAICEPVAEGWSRSTYSVGYYNASPVQLDAPIIRASAPQFDYDTNNTIYVNLDNPNDPAVSEIEYRINGGDWKTYNDRRKRFKEEDYPDGATIEARAIATAEYYLDSDTATRDIGPAVATVLEPPVITFSHTSFSDDVKKIEVIIENPNPEGSSRIYYALTDPEKVRDETEELRYKKYKDEFDEKRKNWPHGFAVIAYCQARHAQYQDSLPTEAETGNVDAPEPPTPEEPTGLAGGHFDLDTSSFIAEFHRGTTDAHVHEYDKKYDVPGADFFDLQGGKLHNITEDVSNGAKFKLIIINPDLSPGGRLVINDTYDDTQPATWIPVQEYANIPLEDLPVFSFTGAAGTTPLTQLGLYFDVNAIADGEIVPTNTGDVRKNVPGKYGEWRNGALTIQAVRVNGNGSHAFTTSLAVTSGGLHGGATSGLLWESTLFWHWEGESYHEPENPHEPTPPEPPVVDPPLFTPLFTGNTSGEFYDPTGQAGMVTNLGRSNYFEWGTPAHGFYKGSNITFTGNSFENVGVGELFDLGSMRYHNSTIFDGTDTHGVKFDLTLDLDIPDVTEVLNFSFELYSTINSFHNTADENADYFTFGNFTSDFTTTLDGQLYGLELQFGEVTENGFSTIHQFHTHETKAATGTLFGSFYAIDPSDLDDPLIP